MLLSAALPGGGAIAQAPPAPAREAPQEKVICKKAAPAGTRFRTETCYTMAEWDQLSEVTRRDMGEMVLRAPKKRNR
jgi:hypothetical protein